MEFEIAMWTYTVVVVDQLLAVLGRAQPPLAGGGVFGMVEAEYAECKSPIALSLFLRYVI